MYYLLDAVPGPVRWVGEDAQQQYWEDNKISWISGIRFSNGVIPNPLVFSFQPVKNTWDHGPHMPDFLKGAIMPILHDDVIEAMLEAGVNNIDIYPTRINDPESGEIFSNFKAINITGLVATADMTRSMPEAHDNTPKVNASFNDSKALDVLLFRLTESHNTILVHEKLKDFIEEKGINNIEFHSLDTVAIL